MHSVDPTTESMIRSVLAYAENRLRLDPVPLDRGSTDPARLDAAVTQQARLAAALSLILWAGLIISGRLIAFDA